MRFISFVFASVIVVFTAACETPPIPLSPSPPEPVSSPIVTDFTVSSYPRVGVGQQFFVWWEVQGADLATLTYTGPVACRRRGAGVSDCATCIANSTGGLRFIVEARGGNDGRGNPVSVSETLNVNAVAGPAYQPAITANFIRCGA